MIDPGYSISGGSQLGLNTPCPPGRVYNRGYLFVFRFFFGTERPPFSSRLGIGNGGIGEVSLESIADVNGTIAWNLSESTNNCLQRACEGTPDSTRKRRTNYSRKKRNPLPHEAQTELEFDDSDSETGAM